MTNNISIYIEAYSPNSNKKSVEYSIDFLSDTDTYKLLSVISPSHLINPEYSSSKFYKLIMPFQGRNRMIEGHYYSLPIDLFNNADYTSLDFNIEGSATYAGIINNIKTYLPDTFSKYRITPEKYQITPENLNPTYNSQLSHSINSTANKLIVVNCGQGNWNEIFSKNHVLIYDIGASTRLTHNHIVSLVQNRFAQYNTDVSIIISHWDMDHFQSLTYLTHKELQKINAIYAPDNLPSSNVYQTAISLIIKNNIPIYFIPPTPNKAGKRIILNQIFFNKTLDIYRASKGSSRNQTGIVLVIKKEKRIILLTGDHHYEKILSAIKNKYTGKELILLAPHHGGTAGKLNVPEWKTEFSDIQCAISVGPNSYNHPQQNLPLLNILVSSQPLLQRTDINGDITYLL